MYRRYAGTSLPILQLIICTGITRFHGEDTKVGAIMNMKTVLYNPAHVMH